MRALPGAYSGNVTTASSLTLVGTGATSTGGVDSGVGLTLTVRGMTAAGFDCQDQGTLTLRDVVATGGGLVTYGCQVTATGSKFEGAFYLEVITGSGTTATFDRCEFGTLIPANAMSTQTITVRLTNSIVHGLDLTHFAPSVAVNISLSYSTFYAGGGTAVTCGPDSTLPSGLSFVNDIFYAPNTTTAVNNQGTKCFFDTNIMYPQAASTGTATIIQDPKLVNAGGGDLHLQTASPAIDAARTTANDPSTDYDGTLRPQGPKWDIGAFEYH